MMSENKTNLQSKTKAQLEAIIKSGSLKAAAAKYELQRREVAANK